MVWKWVGSRSGEDLIVCRRPRHTQPLQNNVAVERQVRDGGDREGSVNFKRRPTTWYRSHDYRKTIYAQLHHGEQKMDVDRCARGQGRAERDRYGRDR